MSHISKAKLSVLFYIFITLVGCTNKNQSLPEGVLDKETMIDVVVDVQMLEAAHKATQGSSKQKMSSRDTSYMIVFNKYGINREIYDSTMRSYSRRPKLFGEVLEQAAQRINARK